MSPRGRKASLPGGDSPRRPPVRVPGSLLVEHRDKSGEIARYDFATLPCPEPMQESLAALFAARCTREGGWQSHKTSRNYWYHLRTFATWVSGRTPVVKDVDDVTAGTWREWRLGRPTSAMGRSQITAVAIVLRNDPRIGPATREEMDRLVRPAKVQEQSFTPEEFKQIATAARRVFRAAHLRITANAAVLNRWRADEFAEGSDEWLVGEALDCAARTGDVPHYVSDRGIYRVRNRYIRVLGGAGAPAGWRRLFLSRHEATALAVLFTVGHGLNLSTVSGLAVPRATPDPGEDGVPVYRLEFDKPRCGAGRRFETRNLTDFGAGSPGRLVTEALEATAFARALVHEEAPDLNRLLIWRDTQRNERRQGGALRVGPFGFGVTPSSARNWATAEGFSASPFRRGRRTVNVQHRKEPGQNSQDTHDSVYVLRDRQAQQMALGDIAAGIVSAVGSARSTVLRAVLREEPDPMDAPTATADCHDNKHSPFTAHGVTCGASFLMCLACPNARVHPGHHVRLAYLDQALESLRSVMDPLQWNADWHDTHGRLGHLKTLLGQSVWDQALKKVTDTDRDVIDHLLKGDFDQ